MLLIGAHKAELYTRALIGDIVHKRRDLADPGWLVRVGPLPRAADRASAMVEAVKDEAATCSTADERDVFETRAFAELRPRLNVEGWRGVWELRKIAFRGRPRTGPVAA